MQEMENRDRDSERKQVDENDFRTSQVFMCFKVKRNGDISISKISERTFAEKEREGRTGRGGERVS